MFPNAKPSEIIALLATVDPVSEAAGTVTTGWVPFADFLKLLAVVQTGVMGASATVDAKLQQAQDSAGTGVKDIAGFAITQIVKATGDNKQAFINIGGGALDVNGGFSYVRLSITVGVAASLVSGQIWGSNPRFADASAYNQAGVIQIV